MSDRREHAARHRVVRSIDTASLEAESLGKLRQREKIGTAAAERRLLAQGDVVEGAFALRGDGCKRGGAAVVAAFLQNDCEIPRLGRVHRSPAQHVCGLELPL